MCLANAWNLEVKFHSYYYLRHLASREGIAVIGVCVCVCVWVCLWVCLSVRPAATACRNAALVSAAKVMCCDQYSLVYLCTHLRSQRVTVTRNGTKARPTYNDAPRQMLQQLLRSINRSTCNFVINRLKCLHCAFVHAVSRLWKLWADLRIVSSGGFSQIVCEAILSSAEADFFLEHPVCCRNVLLLG